MRNGDAASSSFAAHWPDIADELDSLPDVLREKIAALAAPLPRTASERASQFMGILALALQAANVGEAVAIGPPAVLNSQLIEGLRDIANFREFCAVEDDDPLEYPRRFLAYCAALVLKQLGLLDWSDDKIARVFRIVSTRAAVQGVRVKKLEPKVGRCRSSKSDGTRERCRQRRMGVRRKPRTDKWVGFECYAKAA